MHQPRPNLAKVASEFNEGSLNTVSHLASLLPSRLKQAESWPRTWGIAATKSQQLLPEPLLTPATRKATTIGVLRKKKIFATFLLIISRRPDQSLQSKGGKNRVCLDCNGAAVASPALLQVIPHVLLASAKATKLNKIPNVVEVFRTRNDKNREQCKTSRLFQAGTEEIWFFCSSVIPKPHSWKPGFINHCFASILVLSATRF